MKILKNISPIFIVYVSVFIFNSCESTSPAPYDDLAILPSMTMPSKEIMQIQGIKNIHYVDYDSVIVNGQIVNSFSPTDEYYLDSCHYKIMQYYLDNHNWNTTVYNLCNGTGWNYYSGVVNSLQNIYLAAAYEQAVQSALASWLKGPRHFWGTEYIDGKLCNVYTDSTGYREWIWIKYKLPIQRRNEGSYDVHEIGVVRKRAIEINQPIYSNVFEPPK